MLKRRHDNSAVAILEYLKDSNNFERIQNAYPIMDLDIAIDILHETSHNLHNETKAFLQAVIEAHAVSKSQSPTKAFKEAQSPERQALSLRATTLALKIGKFATKIVVQDAPNVAIAGAIAAAMLGNNPEPENLPTPLCNDTNLSICDDNALILFLNDNDQKIIRGMIATTNSKKEKEAIEAIARASVETKVDVSILLVFAQLESSLGKLTNPKTSSAQGIFQYVEQTWMESLVKHRDHLSEDIQQLADHIFKKDGGYDVEDKAIKTEILDLRNQDPVLHANITSLDMIAEDDMVLKSNWEENEKTSKNPHKDILEVAKALNMERVAEFMVGFYQAITDDIHNDAIVIDQSYYDKKEQELITFVTKVYMKHFLGDRGSDRFFNAYNNENLRDAPVRSLVNTPNKALSSRAIKANFDFFNGGKKSSVQIYDSVKAKVAHAYRLVDTRIKHHELQEKRQPQFRIANTQAIGL